MPFFQAPPALGNQFTTDRVLRSYLARALPPDVARAIESSLEQLGELAGGELYQLQLADRLSEPRLTQWDAWGRRIDRIDVTPLWQRAASIAAEHGLVSTAYERVHGEHSRMHQFALAYLFAPSTDVYGCPLAMTDGAARTLVAHRNAELLDRALPRLLSRDARTAWTSGQWMTERAGGSDVGRTETVARQSPDGWKLFGTKWFSSATTSQMALTLARPEGNPDGGRGLALFYVEMRREDGTINGIAVNRLKDKLGTRKVPTAELTLDGAIAIPVTGLTDGVRNIAPMLNITRTWNAICSASTLRRSIALARDYAQRREAFGSTLSAKPLHLETLADMQAEFEGAFHLTFRAVELLGREETGKLSAGEADLLRLITPVAKLVTGKQAVAGASEALEAFGGAGYVEDTGLPALLRDAQVLSIWEGTTNVLALDVLRVVARGDALAALTDEVRSLVASARAAELVALGRIASDAVSHAGKWLRETASSDLAATEAGARRFATTLGRALSLALLVRHAQWSVDTEDDRRASLAAARYARRGVDFVVDDSIELRGTAALANDSPLTA